MLRRQGTNLPGGRLTGATWKHWILSMARSLPPGLQESCVVAGVEKVDIGFPYYRTSRIKEVKERKQLVKENRKNAELERASRLRTLKLSLDHVQEIWEKTSGPFHIKKMAEHYGVFRDLFPMAHFLPQVPLRICYSQDTSAQVYYGNRLTPTEAASVPQISFEAEEGSLWTLMLTCPDEHLLDNEAEYVHWLVGNIPGGAVQAGEELCHYLPPFPPRGTGFHRYVYVLFKQEGRIDFQEDARPTPCYSLADRSFKTIDFYRKHQDDMTPAGVAFFQSQWDESVTNTFHTTLNMREPVFEFSRPPVYHPPQVKFPHRQPLRYLDRYRDGKEHSYGIY
ncbi:large ribosomal subunit protein mL38 isoform X2 [Cottoperca gobio]|uniref:Large ribosomal subunit protein mL38 n=1 Tax=Cottoperca gobio TaxID=56716 RepID=A0A6J2RTN3_COTGO|nr:39S ribosomal protein L38, mitochondrial isoform X2 [Cottoperca gobio]